MSQHAYGDEMRATIAQLVSAVGHHLRSDDPATSLRALRNGLQAARSALRRCQVAADVHVVSDSDVDEAQQQCDSTLGAEGGQAGTQASQDPYLETSTAMVGDSTLGADGGQDDPPTKRIKREGCL